MAEIVYMLCALTSAACTGLLLRGYFRTRFQLLLWSGTAFLAFTVANILLFLDLVMFPNFSLLMWRQGVTVFGAVVLLYGLIRSDD